MHFTYSDKFDEDLAQGDILGRTPEIESILKEVHPHYYSKNNNQYLIVLTQSCDLARRKDLGGKCKARYISLAPVRSLKEVLEREVNSLADILVDVELPVCTQKTRNRLYEALLKIVNNNHPEYFYLHSEPSSKFPDNCAAFLRLSIAIKSEKHYESCLKARRLSLKENFRSKLGWLVGQMYSRVGTEDWDKDAAKKFVSSELEERAIWINDKQLKRLKTDIKNWISENPDNALDGDSVAQLISKIKPKKEEILSRITEVLTETPAIKRLIDGGAMSNEDVLQIITKLKNDPTLTTLFQ